MTSLKKLLKLSNFAEDKMTAGNGATGKKVYTQQSPEILFLLILEEATKSEHKKEYGLSCFQPGD